jgi:DNA-binding transcriptional LysR family regulator
MSGPAPFDLNLRHLGAAAAVARAGSMVAAAQLENMSQSALTQAVGKLEKLLGVQLFDRRPGGTMVTGEGAAFFQRTDQALAFIKEGALAVRRTGRAGSSGNIAYRITMSQLRALVAVRRCESFTGAAAMTGLSQPTIHRAVRDAERSLDTKFFMVSGKTVRATEQGLTLARFARLAMVELQTALDELEARHSPSAGRIVIGSLPLARAALLPAALARFSRENPDAAIVVVEGTYAAMLDDLRHGEIDMLLGALREPAPAPDVVEAPLFSTGLHVVAGASHPLAGRRQVGVARLAEYPWVITRRGAPMRQKWERFFASAGVPEPARVIECGSVVVIRGLLLRDVFLTLLSEDQFRLEEAEGLLVRIGPALPTSERRIGVTHRTHWRPTNLQSRFLELLREVAVARLPEAKGGPAEQYGKLARG